jgi:hypothetical protein
LPRRTALAKLHHAVALPCDTSRSCRPRSPERRASRCGAAHPTSPLSPSLYGRGVQSVATVGYHPCQAPGVLASAAGGRRPTVVRPRCGHTLRFYIRPHFRKCRPVVPLTLHLVPVTAARPPGFLKRALCKVDSAPCGVVFSAGFSPGASRSTSVSGLRPCAGYQPPPTPGPRRFAALARAVCPSAPRGGSLIPRKPLCGLRPQRKSTGHVTAQRRSSESLIVPTTPRRTKRLHVARGTGGAVNSSLNVRRWQRVDFWQKPRSYELKPCATKLRHHGRNKKLGARPSSLVLQKSKFS